MGYPPPTKAIGQKLAYGTAYVLEKAGGFINYFMSFRPKLTRQLVYNMSMNHYFSHAKATKEIGYTPMINLDLGIERTMDWIRTGRYTTDIAIFDRWAKVREAISPERPRVVVPMSSRHSSSSSIASLEGLSVMPGDGPSHFMGASPPRWYDLPGQLDAAQGAVRIGGHEEDYRGNSAQEWDVPQRRSSDGRGSPKNDRGSFCASIPEENEVIAYEEEAMAEDLVLPSDSDESPVPALARLASDPLSLYLAAPEGKAPGGTRGEGNHIAWKPHTAMKTNHVQAR
jgi:hypothetical protein